MADNLYIISHERGALTDYYVTIGANAARNTTTPITGSADAKLTYPSGSTTWNTQLGTNLLAVQGFTTRKLSIMFRFKVSATPAANAALFQIGTKQVWINTALKIRLDTTDATMTALTAGTTYRCEAIIEPDSGGPESTGITIKIDGVTVINGASGNAHSSPSFGESTAKAGTGPNCNIQIDDVVVWTSDTTTKYTPWLNSQNPQTIRVPVANSATYNDFTGVSDATNKYNNIDEDPTSTTDYVHDGERGVTRRQAFTFTNVASYANTVRGFCVHFMARWSAASSAQTTEKIQKLFRESSVDYTYAQQNNSTTDAVESIGKPTQFDGSALTASSLNALEAGMYIALTDTAVTTAGYTGILPTADGANDGVWTQTGGTGGSAYTAVDENTSSANDADYISSAAAGERQGFTFTFSPSVAALGDTIYKLEMSIRARTNAASGSSGSVKGGVRIGGVNYDGFLSQGVAPSTSTFQTYTGNFLSFANSSDFKNPATGNYFTLAEISSLEFYIKHQILGSGPLEVSAVNLLVYALPNVVMDSMFMEVITGDAFTDNGLLPTSASRLRRMRGFGR